MEEDRRISAWVGPGNTEQTTGPLRVRFAQLPLLCYNPPVLTAYPMNRAMARRGLMIVVLAGMAWGTSGVAAKTLYSLVPVSPITVAAYRLVLGAPLLLLAYRWIGGSNSFRVRRGDLPLLLLVGAALGASRPPVLPGRRTPLSRRYPG